MPMEIFSLQVKGKHVGEHDIERTGNLRNRVGAQIGWRIERRDPQGCCIPRRAVASRAFVISNLLLT
jgi:hypothetical protein